MQEITYQILYKQRDKFLGYLSDIRGYSIESIRTYESTLTNSIYQIKITKKDKFYELDLTPLRVQIKEQSKKTILKKVSIIRSFIEYLRENSFDIKLKADELIKVPKSLPKPISHNIILKALKEATLQERVLILLIYSLGVRISELVNIKLEDVNGEWIRVTGKGDKVREVALIKSVRQLLEEYIKLFNPKVYILEKNSKKLSKNPVRYKVCKVFEKIGIKATPHQLRHSFATEILNAGGRINDVSELLGHSSLSATQVYTKLNNLVKLENYKKAHPIFSKIKEK